MKILYHHRTHALDGQRVHIREIQDALRAAGHEVFEVAPVAADEVAGATPRRSWRRRVFSLLTRVVPPGAYDLLELGYNLIGYRKLACAIRRFRPDFIYERYCASMVAGVWASRRYGVPLLLEVNAPLAEELRRHGSFGFHALRTRLERYVLRSATRILAVTAVLQHHLAAEANLPMDRILVIHNGVRPAAFERSAEANAAERRSLGLEGHIVVGSVGFFRPWHGVDLLLSCVAGNELLRTRAKVLLVGEGPAVPALKEQARRLGISDRVVFTGSIPHDQVPRYLGAIDVALMPRAVEYCSPLKLFEYMAAGKAIVAPRQENLTEILTDGADVLFFTPEDPVELEVALVKAVADDKLRQRLGEEARRTIRDRGLTWDGNAQRIVEAFTDLQACLA